MQSGGAENCQHSSLGTRAVCTQSCSREALEVYHTNVANVAVERKQCVQGSRGGEGREALRVRDASRAGARCRRCSPVVLLPHS
jgi:hypothetical protein